MFRELSLRPMPVLIEVEVSSTSWFWHRSTENNQRGPGTGVVGKLFPQFESGSQLVGVDVFFLVEICD